VNFWRAFSLKALDLDLVSKVINVAYRDGLLIYLPFFMSDNVEIKIDLIFFGTFDSGFCIPGSSEWC
jgi:hypothetical protein